MSTLRRTVSTTVIAIAVLAAIALPAWAGYSKTYSFGPDEGNSKGPCAITFAGSDSSAEIKGHVDAAYAAFADAMARSKFMRAKVFDSCQKHGQAVTINIGKNLEVFGVAIDVAAGSIAEGKVWVDVADFAALADSFTGKPQDVTKLLGLKWYWILAHEIDHTRHDADENHKDPDPDPAKRTDQQGPAVKDENHVHSDLGTGVSRNNYFGPVIFDVDRQVVTWDVSKLIRDLSMVTGDASPPLKLVEDASIDAIATNWMPAHQLDGDFDLDGVPLTIVGGGGDSAPNIFNPGQVDVDRDGIAQVLDSDDDGDGIPDVLEYGAGADAMDPSSEKEHWSVAGSCSNGKDDDRDDLTDDADSSCAGLAKNLSALPDLVKPGPTLLAPHNRTAEGGVPQGYDLLNAKLGLSLDTQAGGLNGSPDEQADFSGVVLVRRGPAGHTVPGGGTDRVPIEIIALNLVSVAPITVVSGVPASSAWRVKESSQNPGSPCTGRLDRPQTGLYRIDSFFDIWTELSLDGSSPARTLFPGGCLALDGDMKGWPPYNESLALRSGAPLVFLRDAGVTPVASVRGATLSFPATDLRVTHSVSPSLVTAGDIQRFRAVVKNDAASVGPVVIEQTLPGISSKAPQIIKMQSTSGSCLSTVVSGKRVVRCNSPRIASGATVTVDVTTVPRYPYDSTSRAVVKPAASADVPIDMDWSDNSQKRSAKALARGACTIVGTPFADTIVGTSGADVICGLAGKDKLSGGGGNDRLNGGGSADRLNGGRGADVLDGGGGNDRIFPGSGADRVFGGTGKDIVDYSNVTGPVKVNLSKRRTTGSGTDTLSSIDSAVGTSRGDTLKGDKRSNRLWGMKGRDLLYGLAGRDSLDGGRGNDRLDGGTGSDKCRGGAGADTAVRCER